MSSSRRRGRTGMTLASVALSLAVAAARETGDDEHRAAGQVAVEIIATESMGSFRNMARLLSLLAAVASE